MLQRCIQSDQLGLHSSPWLARALHICVILPGVGDVEDIISVIILRTSFRFEMRSSRRLVVRVLEATASACTIFACPIALATLFQRRTIREGSSSGFFVSRPALTIAVDVLATFRLGTSACERAVERTEKWKRRLKADASTSLTLQAADIGLGRKR
eukprot:TRINITY_DN2790_c0_g3_i1.p1 TRINITY_DN2790_c0_g3~~TRINITY_DN2790_c0_g3_i1.p1  ORF type:complete len:156 (+),score=11.34 TRINITY_DN2790_c0_g3_i1:307-774(+)